MSTPASRSASLALFSLLLAVPALGCSDIGIHTLTIEGNDAVLAGGPLMSSDMWEITFDSFHVVVHDPGLIERVDNKPTYVRELGVTVWNVVSDLAEGDALARQIRATRYDGAQFRIAPTSASGYEPELGNVPEDVVDTAVDEGWSIHVVGSASAAMQTIQFDWTFDTNTFYRCQFEGDEVVELGADGDETTTIEILGEALFRSEAGNVDAPVVFQPIADADSNGDNMVTADELEAAGLLDTMVALTSELGGIRDAGPCPEYEAPEAEG